MRACGPCIERFALVNEAAAGLPTRLLPAPCTGAVGGFNCLSGFSELK